MSKRRWTITVAGILLLLIGLRTSPVFKQLVAAASHDAVPGRDTSRGAGSHVVGSATRAVDHGLAAGAALRRIGSTQSVGEGEGAAAPTSALGADGEPTEAEAARALAVTESGAGMTPEEAALLDMYEGIATILDRHTSDCRALGLAIADVVRQNRDALQRWNQARAQLTPAQLQQSTDRLENSVGDQLAHLRSSLRTGLGKCPTEKTLQDAILDLAKAGAS